MKEHIDYLSTLFVGIDIASRIHVISALDFNQDFYIKMKPFENTKEGAGIVEKLIADVLADNHQFKYVVIGMESTGFYGVHLANYLSTSELLAPFSVRVYCLNPKEVKNYKKSFNDIGKNDGRKVFFQEIQQELRIFDATVIRSGSTLGRTFTGKDNLEGDKRETG